VSGESGAFLVVGLGNPGIEYQFTPHNAGFLAIDRIAGEHNAEVVNRRCRALTARIQMAGREVILAKPETWMNLSGLAVGTLVDELDTEVPANLLVVYDELDLPLGKLRIRERGSPAGHNGARSVSGVWERTSGGGSGLGLGQSRECSRRLFVAARIIC
jgi:peptidyl-tRNA hydrolase, PTH1 family